MLGAFYAPFAPRSTKRSYWYSGATSRERRLDLGPKQRLRNSIASCSIHGHTGTVKLFLRNGASIGALNRRESIPLHLVSQNGHSDIVRLLKYSEFPGYT